MTDPHLPFLRAICAAPDDDLPRLLYAEWLDEHDRERWEDCDRCAGDGYLDPPPGNRSCRSCDGNGGRWRGNGFTERAEFIRVQCRIAALTDDRSTEGCQCPRCIERDALRRRERELLTTGVYRSLLPDLEGRDKSYWPDQGMVGYSTRPPDPDRVMAATPHRGFPSDWSMSWFDCRAHLSAIRERTPVRKVRLTDQPVLPAGTGLYTPHRGTTRHDDYPGIEFELPQRHERSEWYDEQIRAMTSDEWRQLYRHKAVR